MRLDFESLGFLPDQVRVLKRLLRRPEGMLIFSLINVSYYCRQTSHCRYTVIMGLSGELW